MQFLKNIALVHLIILLFSSTLFSQNESLDSLKSIYDNLEDGQDKINLSHSLFKKTFHHNKELAYKYALEQLSMSKKMVDTKGEGTAYRDIAYYFRYLPHVDSARFYFEKSIKTFQDNGHKEKQCYALDRYATFEIVQGNYETALDLVDRSINIATEIKDGEILVDLLQRKSVVHLDMGDFASAMDVVLQSLAVADTTTPPYMVGKGVGMSDIGRIEIHRNNNEAALKPTLEALQIFDDIGDDKWKAVSLNQLGNAYWNMEEYDKSLEAYQNSLKIVTALNRQDYIATAKANMAGIYSKRGEYEKAVNMINEAQKITLNVGSMGNIINNYGMLGDIELENDKPKKAIEAYSLAIHIGDSVRAIDDLYSMYKSRSEAFEKLGQYQLALADQREYQLLYDSIFSAGSINRIEELKNKYQNQKNENELIKRESEIALLEQKNKVANSRQIWLGIASLFFLCFASALYYGFRQKIKRNAIKQEAMSASLEFKEKKLTTHALHLAHKNKVLLDLKSQIGELKSDNNNARKYQSIINNINLDVNNDNNWDQFRTYFEDVHKDFNANIKKSYPEVNSNDLRLMSLLKMNLSSKEIASILNISTDGVKKARYRLRKKLNLKSEDSLQELVIAL